MPPTIRKEKTPHRIHYIAEWAERRGLTQADIARATGADKATVSRWCSGALPSEKYLLALTAVTSVQVPNDLFCHPDNDWIARFMRSCSEDERRRVIQLLETAFPPKPLARD